MARRTRPPPPLKPPRDALGFAVRLALCSRAGSAGPSCQSLGAWRPFPKGAERLPADARGHRARGAGQQGGSPDTPRAVRASPLEPAAGGRRPCHCAAVTADARDPSLGCTRRVRGRGQQPAGAGQVTAAAPTGRPRRVTVPTEDAVLGRVWLPPDWWFARKQRGPGSSARMRRLRGASCGRVGVQVPAGLRSIGRGTLSPDTTDLKKEAGLAFLPLPQCTAFF